MEHCRTSAAVVIFVYLLVALFVPVLSPFDPLQMHCYDRVVSPGGNYLFGTDESGHDILSRVMDGSRITLTVGFVSAVISLLLGLTLGLLAGFLGGSGMLSSQG